MSRFFRWALVAVLTAFLVATCYAQAPSVQAGAKWTPFQYGIVTDSARVWLEQSWDLRNPRQNERGACIEPADVSVDTSDDRSSVSWNVHHLTLPDSVTLATPYAISFNCSATAIGSLHTHTPTSCEKDRNDPVGFHVKTCVIGGPEAYVCSVDEWDRHMATRNHDEVMAVQCDRSAVVFFWPGKRG